MKFVKLCHDDPDIFSDHPQITAEKCDFLVKNFEAFMQMYKSQGSTFWLRFLVSFQKYNENKLCHSKEWITLVLKYFKFVKVLNYMYISIHKRFIEGSNTSVKKFVNNLVTLALHSPAYLSPTYSCQQWLAYIKSAKHLHTTFQNLFGVSDPLEYSGFTAFVYNVYTDFFCALNAVFEHWHRERDLTEEELKRIDTKIIYWLPPYNDKSKPLCFEKYLSNYWKENLQRMLLMDSVRNVFHDHKMAGCCEKFDKEKNMFRLFKFSEQHMKDLMDMYSMETDGGKGDTVHHTVTEVCLKEVFKLRPHVTLCTQHKDCFVRICHKEENCREPFICEGNPPCTLTCESALAEKTPKEEEKDKFWKTVSVECFPINEKKRDASTLAESYDRAIQTYLHVRDGMGFNGPLSMLRHTYPEFFDQFHGFPDFNPRKTECLNRLRRKLYQKKPSSLFTINPSLLKEPYFHESLLAGANLKMHKSSQNHCFSQSHVISKCGGKCFRRNANSVALSSSDAFGRVIHLSRTCFSVPCDTDFEEMVNIVSDKNASPMHNCEEKLSSPLGEVKNDMCVEKSECKKRKKSKKTTARTKYEDESLKSEENVDLVAASVRSESADSFKSCMNNSSDPKLNLEDDSSEINIDDDVDEILKLIGIGEEEEEESAEISASEESRNEDKAVETFFELIGMKDLAWEEDMLSAGVAQKDNVCKLRVCAYCKRKETRRKMFKKCSRCKEENFPVQHYYCSPECLMEDWTETHEGEHLRFKKRSL